MENLVYEKMRPPATQLNQEIKLPQGNTDWSLFLFLWHFQKSESKCPQILIYFSQILISYSLWQSQLFNLNQPFLRVQNWPFELFTSFRTSVSSYVLSCCPMTLVIWKLVLMCRFLNSQIFPKARTLHLLD